MGRILLEVLGRAVLDVERMSPAQKVQLGDEIFAQQPNLLAAILVLPRMGVSALQLEVPLHILLVSFGGAAGAVPAALDGADALQGGAAAPPC